MLLLARLSPDRSCALLCSDLGLTDVKKDFWAAVPAPVRFLYKKWWCVLAPPPCPLPRPPFNAYLLACVFGVQEAGGSGSQRRAHQLAGSYALPCVGLFPFHDRAHFDAEDKPPVLKKNYFVLKALGVAAVVVGVGIAVYKRTFAS